MENKLKVGVISCSGMAEGHMRGVARNPEAELTAICDVDTEKMQAVAGRFPGVRQFTDYRELLKTDVDIVIIVTPDQLHREMAIAALEAGKHVLCEKPLALTREDCHAILEAAEKSDKKFMVGQICRYTPGFVAAKELIDAGKIGELVFVESEYAHDYKSIYEAAKGTWRNDPLRNGVVGGGCHAIDLLRWVAGDALEVTAYANRKIMPNLPYDDNTIAILKFPNNVIGKVFVSVSCKRPYTMRSVFYGTKGTIVTDNTSDHFSWWHENEEGTLVEETVPVPVNNHNAAGEFAELCRIIREDLPVKTTALEGTKTVETALAIVRSADLGGEKISLFRV